MLQVRGVRRVVLSAVATSVFVAMSGVGVAHAVTAPPWGDAVPATFATDVQNIYPDAYLTSVSCVSAGNCTAAGSFYDLAGNRQAFTQSTIQPTLPPTGANTNRFLAVAVVLVTAGGVFVATRRRRTISA